MISSRISLSGLNNAEVFGKDRSRQIYESGGIYCTDTAALSQVGLLLVFFSHVIDGLFEASC